MTFKVVHLSTMDTGGAAIAALRLHAGLLAQGVDSSFLSLKTINAQQYPSKFKYSNKPKNLSIGSRVKRKLGIPIDQKSRNQQLLSDKKGSYELFSFPLTDYRLDQHPLVADSDILNLHWVSNFIDYPSFFRNIHKPIVWTFHDMNPFLGGFHYMADVERNRTNMGELEKRIQNEKIRALQDAHNITVVTPSKWLGEISLNTGIFHGGYTHIPYGLDLSIFKPHDSNHARETFNLPINKKIILFVSENVNNYRKGFDLLTDAVNGLTVGPEEVIVAIGQSSSVLPENIIALGRINDDRLMSLLYAAADVFVLPSREDNFPNVMLESIACGTPVIAFPTGGMAEVIENGFNGILAEEISAAALGQSIREFLDGNYSFDRMKIRNFAVENFDLSIQANRYVQLYERLLGRGKVYKP